MRRPLGSLCVYAGTMAACDACKSVAGPPCGTAVASRCCRSDGFWSVPVTLSTRHGPSSRRVPVDRAGDIVACFIKRWSIEMTPDRVRGRLFEESRAHLGFETQRQWSDLAIERTTPCLLSLYSIVSLLASCPVPGGSFGGAQECLVRQEAGDLQRCLGVGEAASVGGRVFFNIGIRHRQGGNFSGLSTMLDPISLLYALTPVNLYKVELKGRAPAVTFG